MSATGQADADPLEGIQQRTHVGLGGRTRQSLEGTGRKRQGAERTGYHDGRASRPYYMTLERVRWFGSAWPSR